MVTFAIVDVIFFICADTLLRSLWNVKTGVLSPANAGFWYV
jgi:hypothetical protein